MITPFLHNSTEWHALRLGRVGGSEVAALFDCQPPYALSRYALWHVKAGYAEPPPVDNPRVSWGLKLEDLIAEAAGEQNGWTVRKGGYVTDDTTEGVGCSLDYIIDADPAEDGPGCLECKNVDWLIHKRSWTDAEPPTHILLQLQHQLAATGFSWGVIAGLVGGNELNVYRYKARPKLIAEIRARVTAFWQSIKDEKPPVADGSDGSMHVLRQLYPDMRDEIADLTTDNELPTLCAELLHTTAERQHAEKAEKDLKAQIMAKLGDTRKANAEGFFINISVTPENPGRPAVPGEIIGKRAEVRKVLVKERIAA